MMLGTYDVSTDGVTDLDQTVHKNLKTLVETYLQQHKLLSYTVLYCWAHLRQATPPTLAILSSAQYLLSNESQRHGILRLVKYLREGEATRFPAHRTPLHFAAYFNVPWLVQHLIHNDQQSNPSNDCARDTPLIWACEMGSLESVKILLRAGSNVNAFEDDGWSALHWAARNGHTAIAKVLCNHGASTTQLDETGLSAADWAYDRGNLDILAVLRDPRAVEVDHALQPRNLHHRSNWRHTDMKPGNVLVFNFGTTLQGPRKIGDLGISKERF